MGSIFEVDKNMANTAAGEQNARWYSVKDAERFLLAGSDALAEEGFHRLTRAEEQRIAPINDGAAYLSSHSSGIQVKFKTDSTHIGVRARLSGAFNMTNMTQTGQCGMDLYLYDENMGDYVLREVARYPFDAVEYEVNLAEFEGKKTREFILYFPLYSGVLSAKIGLDEDAKVCPAAFEAPGRIAVYGTSIAQGASASRPGLSPTNVLSRRLGREVLNFGFSGTAFLEKEMGEIIGGRQGIEALIVDAEANAGVDERMRDNLWNFLDAFLKCNPLCPVTLFSRTLFSLDCFDSRRVTLREYYKNFLKKTAQKYRAASFNLYFYDGSKLFKGNFTDYTADGVHPNDLGMNAIATAYERAVKRMLT